MHLYASPAVLLDEGLDEAPRCLLVLDVAENCQQAFSFTNLGFRKMLSVILVSFNQPITSYLYNAIMSGNVEMVRIRYVRICLLKMYLEIKLRFLQHKSS